MKRRKFLTNYHVWAFASVCIFLGLGFVDITEGVSKGDCSYWHNFGILVRDEHAAGLNDILPSVLFHTGMLALPSIVLGWVFQAIVVCRRSSLATHITATLDDDC